MEIASQARAVLTVEEHVPQGGLGALVAQAVGANCPRKVVNLSLPDAPTISGTSKELFHYYGIDADGINGRCKEL